MKTSHMRTLECPLSFASGHSEPCIGKRCAAWKTYGMLPMNELEKEQFTKGTCGMMSDAKPVLVHESATGRVRHGVYDIEKGDWV